MEIRSPRKGLLPLAIVISFMSALAAPGAEPNSEQFSPATYASDGVGVNSRIAVFPSDRSEFTVPLPLTLRYLAYGGSGQSLYATAFKRVDAKSFTDMPGLFRIELNPVRVSPVLGLDAFGYIQRLVVSRTEDKILFAGTRTDGRSETCGLFELTLQDHSLRPVLQTADCRAGSPWRVFDLSPSGSEALISANRSVALLDLAGGKITPMGSDLRAGSFSPDGKWIAALELGAPGQSKTILIDPRDFSRRRDLGGTNDDEVVWSPDSRFLVHAVYRPSCPSQNPIALETIEIESGKRATLKNSICNAGAGRDLGWVSNQIGR